MVKEIILIGGGDYRKEENQRIDRYIGSKLNSNSKILIIPFAVKEKCRRLSRFNSVSMALKERGLKNFEVINEDKESTMQMINKIDSSDAIFITGGDPKLLLDSLKKLGLISSIKKYEGVIIGYSAGAMILSKKCIIVGGIEKDYPKTIFLDYGIGLINNLAISPHYKKEDDDVLKDLSHKHTICGISDKSALIYRNKKFSKIGEVFIFKCGEKSKFNSSFLGKR